VTLHCRRDHFSPTRYEHTAKSLYQASYSPSKAKNYNQPEIEKGLSRFRKYQNSTTMLPSIPKVSEGSQYQKAYSGHYSEKDPRGQEKASYFLKYNWALDPTSNYQVPLFLYRKAINLDNPRCGTKTTRTDLATISSKCSN